MSPSNSASVSGKESFPAWMKFLYGFIALVLILVGINKGVPAWKKEAYSRKINSIGVELVAELDSYGPIDPAEGKRGKISYDDFLSPTRKWEYSGKAEYSTEPSSPDQKTPEEARDALRAYLADNGWGEGQEDPSLGGLIFFKGDWVLRLFYDPNPDPKLNSPHSPNSVRFRVESPNFARVF